MPANVVAGIKNHLRRRIGDLRVLQISWFGGEPLLAFEIIEEIGSYIKSLLASNSKAACYTDITTNAYLLTPEKFDRLCKLGIGQYQISFDGVRADHDQSRVQAGGGPTFDRVWGNLVGMQNSREDFTALVRLHLDAKNVKNTPSFINQFRGQFGGDSRFRLFIRPLSRLGGPNDPNLAVLDPMEAADIAKGFALECGKLGIPNKTMAEGEDVPICYASKMNAWVVRSNGRLNKCTVALDSEVNDVGYLSADGSFFLDKTRLKPWIRGLDSKDAGELGCPLEKFPAFVRQVEKESKVSQDIAAVSAAT